ncbi:hypothetical protein OH492_13000 [Vibrio chagasii]|nr:hypothetical protein [Vibrio chagasii]
MAIVDEDEATLWPPAENHVRASVQKAVCKYPTHTYKRMRSSARAPHHYMTSPASERLLRQVYCCLVSSHDNGVIKPELAHHWRHDEASYQWTFHLFVPLSCLHNDEPIDADHCDSLSLPNSVPFPIKELAHVSDISAPTDHRVESGIYTKQARSGGSRRPEPGVKYGIQPPSQVNMANNNSVIGSGPFSV